MSQALIRITTGAICEGNCFEWWDYGWMGIAGFFFIMWGITLYLLERKKRK